MIAVGDARERRARLALAAGAERHDLVGRQVAVDIDVAEILDAVEIAGLARHLRDAVHRAPDQHHLAVAGRRRQRHRPDARHVGGEGGDADAAGRARDQIGKRVADIGFRGRAALAHRIGGIAEQREAAVIAERAQLGLVGRRTDHRCRIDLPVAGVQHGAEPGAHDQTVRFRDRMGHRHELDVERAEREAAAERHDIDRNFRSAALALPLGFEQRGRERRRVDRQLEPWPQIDESAEMVLMRVGEHDAEDVAAFFDQETDVGQDQVDARQLLLARERDADIDDDPLPARRRAEAVEREIHPDLADAAERRKNQFVGPRGHHC